MWHDVWYALKGITYVVVFFVTVCVGSVVLITVFIVGSLIEIGKGEKTL